MVLKIFGLVWTLILILTTRVACSANQNYTAPLGKILYGKIAELLKFNIDVKNLTVANKQTNKHKFNIDSPRGQPLTPYPKWPKNKKK